MAGGMQWRFASSACHIGVWELLLKLGVRPFFVISDDICMAAVFQKFPKAQFIFQASYTAKHPLYSESKVAPEAVLILQALFA